MLLSDADKAMQKKIVSGLEKIKEFDGLLKEKAHASQDMIRYPLFGLRQMVACQVFEI